MSEDRVLVIYAQTRQLLMDEDRELEVRLESRALPVPDDERELEVYLP